MLDQRAEDSDAIAKCRSKLADAEHRFGPTSHEVLLSLQELAELLRNEKRLLEAVNVEARANAIRDKHFTNVGSSTAAIETDLVGSLIGNYRIEKVLGRGAMGTVYLGLHSELNRNVAIKVLRRELVSEQESLARFEREARAISALTHPNVVRLLDYGKSASGEPYLIMDFVDGQTLSSYFATAKPAPNVVLPLFIQVCEALQHAHSKGIIHRDVKQNNILVVQENGTPAAKLVDFGIARVSEPGLETATLTETGGVIGSPPYMSPEQCLGYKLDERSDLYSLGCVMFEVFCGRKLFDGANAVQIINQHLNKSLQEARATLQESRVSARLADVILKCLSKKPEKRFANARELKLELSRILGAKAPPPVLTLKDVIVRAPICIVIGLALAYATYLSLHRSPPRPKAAEVIQYVQISDHRTGSVLYRVMAGTITEATEKAARNKILLENADLRNTYLRAADLKFADMPRASFDGSELAFASFSHADLVGASFKSCLLNNADFRNAKLPDANFESSRCNKAYFCSADAPGANFKYAALEQARLNEGNFSGASFDVAQMTGAVLSKCNLQKARLDDATLDKALLMEADLRSASLRGCTFRGANLTNADLTGADIARADFTGAVLNGTKMPPF